MPLGKEPRRDELGGRGIGRGQNHRYLVEFVGIPTERRSRSIS
jgi:hypothetical protein